MKYEDFQKLDLKRGTRVVVTWLDAAEIYKPQYESLTDEDAVTVVETVGEFVGIHVSPFYPEMVHILIYEGQRYIYNQRTQRNEKRHAFMSIPLSLVQNIEILKRARRTIKAAPTLYVLNLENGEKHIVRGKVG